MTSMQQDDRPDSGGEEDDDDHDEELAEEESVASNDGRKLPAKETGRGGQPPKKKRRRQRVISALQESKWQQMYQRLLVYQRTHGSCLVPNRYAPDQSLGAWVATQRRNYRVFMSGSDEPSGMTSERVQSLEDIGFQWTTTDPRHEPWEVRYSALKQFVQKYGHAEIPMRWEENVQLSNWVSKQRQDYKLRLKGKSSRLTDERMKLLNDLGFKWHIPRKGRKIKQQSIPIVKRIPAEGGGEPSSAAAQPAAQGLEPPGTLATGAIPPTISIPDMAGLVGAHILGQAPSQTPRSLLQPPATAGVASSLQNTGIAPLLGQSAAAIDPATLLSLQGMNVLGIDLGSLLGSSVGLQSSSASSGSGYLSGNSGVAAMNLQALVANNANVGERGILSGAATVPQVSQTQRGTDAPAAAALFLPFRIDELLSALQQQQVAPVAMPWSSDLQNPYGIPGMALNVPNPVAAAPFGAPSAAAQAISNLLASQLLNAVQQPQQYLNSTGVNNLSSQPAGASLASLLGMAGQMPQHLQHQQPQPNQQPTQRQLEQPCFSPQQPPQSRP